MNDEDRRALAASVAQCATAWPELAVPRAQFESRLLERWDGSTPLAQHLKGVHAADLYLATACRLGDARALARFESEQLAQVPSYLARMRLHDAFVSDVKQALAEKILLGPAPKIAEYVGRGPLGGWVRVVAVRTAIDLTRRRGERRPQPEPEPALLADPELEYLRDRYREEFARAFADAIAGLPSDSRNLLRLHLVEGISMDELGRQLGVHATTVLRRVAAARRAIVEAAKGKLRERLRLSDSEYVSLFKIVRSQLEITIEPLLGLPDEGRDQGR